RRRLREDAKRPMLAGGQQLQRGQCDIRCTKEDGAHGANIRKYGCGQSTGSLFRNAGSCLAVWRGDTCVVLEKPNLGGVSFVLVARKGDAHQTNRFRRTELTKCGTPRPCSPASTPKFGT